MSLCSSSGSVSIGCRQPKLVPPPRAKPAAHPCPGHRLDLRYTASSGSAGEPIRLCFPVQGYASNSRPNQGVVWDRAGVSTSPCRHDAALAAILPSRHQSQAQHGWISSFSGMPLDDSFRDLWGGSDKLRRVLRRFPHLSGDREQQTSAAISAALLELHRGLRVAAGPASRISTSRAGCPR